jgi:iron complex transport system substrate-binding protein
MKSRTRSHFARIGALGLLAAVTASVVGAPGASFAAAKKSAKTSKPSAQPKAKSTKRVGPFPVGIAQPDGVVTISKKPTHIVSLSPTATEILFAVGAGPQVIATDEFSNYPAQAPTTKLSGLTSNVEAIVKYKPDLVVVSDAGDAVKALKKLKVAVLIMPAANVIADTYKQIEQLGAATGNIADAAKVVATMQSEIANIVASVPKRATPLRAYHELDNTLYSVTSKTFIGQMYSLVGISSVADAADKLGSGYPQLSAEYLVKVNPDVVFLADTKCCAQNASTFAQRPGFSSLAAVTGRHVVELDDDIASRWGPRIVDLLRAIVAGTSTMAGTPVPAGV